MRLICGIDEAGRGAVIGPLVLAGIIIEESDNEKLKKINVKDSKLLTRSQREGLFGKIVLISKGYKIMIIMPDEIDNAVKGGKNLNLNWLEADYSAKIINHLSPDEAIIDCPSPNISLYKNYLQRQVANKNIKIHAEHKADLNYPVVSAASILAKVTRDDEIGKIKKSINIDFGSGYPSDTITIDFLEKNFRKYPEIFRKSWMTFKNLHKKKLQKKLEEF